MSQTDKTLNSNVIFGRLVTQLEERVKSVSEEISSLEGVDKRLEELLEKISRLSRQVEGVKAWEQDHSNIEDKLAVSQHQHSVLSSREVNIEIDEFSVHNKENSRINYSNSLMRARILR